MFVNELHSMTVRKVPYAQGQAVRTSRRSLSDAD